MLMKVSLLIKFLYRQAVSVCDEPQGTSCSDYGDRGFVCAPVWTCRNNTIITDGKVTKDELKICQVTIKTSQGLIDVRSTSLEEDLNQCGVLSGTLDVTDKKCDKYDHVCCKRLL